MARTTAQSMLADGVLEVRIPKPEERKPHRVQIGASGASVNGTAEEK
jgi:HSP20 family molecular chaperone IbpA